MGVRTFYILTTLVSVALFGTSCTKQPDKQVPYSGNAVYYWRTTWQLTEKERTFVNTNSVQRIYLRLFDVVNKYEESDGIQQPGILVPQPQATLHFNEPYDLPCEVIPVVYITDDCLKSDSLLAEKVVTRVAQFCETNDLLWNELQIDCDWRKSTRDAYFHFLEKVRAMLKERNCRLSATIRLHQFSQPAPPVDYGVLMCYNTGDLTDKKTKNAILSTKEVKLYAPKLKVYPLPLSAAYPVFSWKRLFRGDKFVALLRDTDIEDTTAFINCGDGNYKVRQSFSAVTPDPTVFGMQVYPGDTVRLDKVPVDTIKLVKLLLDKECPNLHQQVIVYSLNENDISKYTQNEIESIYTSGW
ncbi:MAG: hypothetical protein MJZ02_04665 [Paludibacteraceae bacterium]|nr:hypothetical protein [Paludibacteraceae bacterium]